MKDDGITLGKMIKKVIGSYLAIDFMLLFINLPFSALMISNVYDESKNIVAVESRLLPCILIGSFTLLIYFALTLGYMGPVGEKLRSPFNETPIDKYLAIKASAIVFALPFAAGVFTALTGAGVIPIGQSFYNNTMRFVYNLFYGPVYGFLMAFYYRSWLTPIFPPLIMVCVIEITYWIVLKGFKLPRIFYRQK